MLLGVARPGEVLLHLIAVFVDGGHHNLAAQIIIDERRGRNDLDLGGLRGMVLELADADIAAGRSEQRHRK